MPGAPSAWRSLRPLEITSSVCGHVYVYDVPPKKEAEGRARAIAYLEAKACVPCLAAAQKAEWAQHVADAAARGWTRHAVRYTWVHTCRREVAADYAPDACTCES